MKKILIVILLFIVFGLGVFLTHKFYTRNVLNKTENALIIVDKVKTVAKLITVEGYFSEIYDYKDYYYYDLSFFRKKALLRVKAKVSVGYDMSKMKIESNPETKTIIISGIPDPEILSIDHDVDFYDIQEGTFNSFSEKELTALNVNAKQFIAGKAMESELFIVAEEQLNKNLEIIKEITEGYGWNLKYKSKFEDTGQDSLDLKPLKY